MREIIKKVRLRVPGIALRTSVMVGFPGETQDDFEQLCEFVSESKFTHLGCFAYSQEEGTVAGRMTDQIEASIKATRANFPGESLSVLFQPHLYSRTNDFHLEFAHSLDAADEVVLFPIYPARELPMEGVTSDLIYQNIL